MLNDIIGHTSKGSIYYYSSKSGGVHWVLDRKLTKYRERRKHIPKLVVLCDDLQDADDKVQKFLHSKDVAIPVPSQHSEKAAALSIGSKRGETYNEYLTMGGVSVHLSMKRKGTYITYYINGKEVLN